jgi:hypothetical protein
MPIPLSLPLLSISMGMLSLQTRAHLLNSGVICSILRFRYVDGITRTDDFFWATVQIATWSTIECGASIIAGCLATLRPLLRRIAPSTRNTSTPGSCTPQGSRSCGWSARFAADTFPHFNIVSSVNKAGSSENKSIGQQMEDMEFLARPGRDVIALNGGSRDGRQSTDPILGQQQGVVDGINFPWPAVTRDESKRQTMHAIRTLRDGVAGDGRTAKWQLAKEY